MGYSKKPQLFCVKKCNRTITEADSEPAVLRCDSVRIKNTSRCDKYVT